MGGKGRLYFGISGIPHDALPREELRKGVPTELAGRSAFHFSKCFRYLVRGGLGRVEYDLKKRPL